MKTSRLGAIALSLSLALVACAGHPVRQSPLSPATDAQIEAERQRAAVLAAHPQWSLQGRVALSNGRQGGSGRIDWQQDGETYSVSLSAPITRQSWRLSGDGQSARLDGLQDGTHEGADAEALLRDATGWEIPVSALGAWVRGVPASGLPAAELAFDAQGQLAELRQGGWIIDYSNWQSEPDVGVELPRHLNASKGNARVRLVVDAWQEGAQPP